MAVNRFNSPLRAEVRSKFVPLPLQLLDASIERAQKQYDRNKAVTIAAQESVYGVKALNIDKQRKKDIQSLYSEQVESAVDDAGGDYGRLTAFADKIAGDVKRNIQSGELGAMQRNALSVSQELEDLKKRKEKGNLSDFGESLAMHRINTFGGTKELASGGFSSVDFYRPVEYLEVGKVSDDYATVIADQYLRTGEKYISAPVASKYVYSNLLNNPQAVANAREQIEATFPGASQKDKNIATRALLKNYANVAGKKIAYRQHFKPVIDASGGHAKDTLTGKKINTFDTTGAQVPGKFDYGEGVADKLMKLSKLEGSPSTQLAAAYRVRSSVYDTKGGVSRKEAEKATQEVEEALKNPYYTDLAKVANVTRKPKESVTDYMTRLKKGLEKYGKSSINTRYTNLSGDTDDEAFKSDYIDTNSLANENVYDMKTGEKVGKTELGKLLRRSRIKDSTDEDRIDLVYSGEVMATQDPQPFGIGTKIASYIDAEGETHFLAVNPKNVNNPVYVRDRVGYALKNGMTQYQDGTNKITMIRGEGGTVNIYRDSKSVRTVRPQQSQQGMKFINVKRQ